MRCFFCEYLCPTGRVAALVVLAFIAGLAPRPMLAGETVAQEIRAELARPGLLGAAKVRMWGVSLYTARLYTEGGARFAWEAPFALELTYRRGFSDQNLVRATVKELERMEGAQPDHDAIQAKLGRCFRDVDAGDRFVASARGRDGLRFFLNGQMTCDITHPDLRTRVMGIWLSDNTRNASLSRELRGM